MEGNEKNVHMYLCMYVRSLLGLHEVPGGFVHTYEHMYICYFLTDTGLLHKDFWDFNYQHN